MKKIIASVACCLCIMVNPAQTATNTKFGSIVPKQPNYPQWTEVPDTAYCFDETQSYNQYLKEWGIKLIEYSESTNKNGTNRIGYYMDFFGNRVVISIADGVEPDGKKVWIACVVAALKGPIIKAK